MRLMLGVDTEPSLLVETPSTSTDCFEFWVINGAWEGKFDSGELTVYAPGGDEKSLTIELKFCVTTKTGYVEITKRFLTISIIQTILHHK